MDPISLDDAKAKDRAVAGSKAATLARLKAMGFSAPDGWVIPVEMAAAIVADPGSVYGVVEAIVVDLGYAPLAVRSSAAAEDLGGASFAGMYETYLNVTGEAAVIDAVRKCVESARAGRVASYTGSGASAAPAVLIQKMVQPDAAGVAFTMDPVTGDARVLVSAVAGLGDRLVGGEANPEEWHVDRAARKATRQTQTSVMGEETALEVAKLAMAVEEKLGEPQDIEWAVKDGEVWLLQARPITVVPVRPARGFNGTGWEKDLSHNPEPVTPFGAAFYNERMAEAVGAGMCEPYGLVARAVEFDFVGGESYMRVVPLFGSAETRGRKAPPKILLAILSRILPPMRRANRQAKRAIESGVLESVFDRWDNEWKPQLLAEEERLRAIRPETLDDAQMNANLDEMVEHWLNGVRIHFEIFLPYCVALSELDDFCQRKLGWDTAKTMTLLTGLSRASVMGRDAFAPIAAKVNDSPAARAAIERKMEDPVAALAEVDKQLSDSLAAWTDRHALRTTNYDAGSPTLSERPEGISRMLLDGVSESPDGAELRQRTEVEAMQRLSGEDAIEFNRRLAFARRAYPAREDNMVLTDSNPCGLMRRWALEAGRRLADRGRLAIAADVVWLESTEIQLALVGDSDADLNAIIKRRKSEYAWVRANPGPVFVGERDEMPDISALPAPMRRTNSALLWAIAQEYPREDVKSSGDALLTGNPASPGTVTGPVKVVMGEQDFGKVMAGDIIVSPVTTPSWTMLFSTAAAVITDGGGVLSHAAIVAREHGIPAVIGARNATSTLKDGQRVTVDGATGHVRLAG